MRAFTEIMAPGIGSSLKTTTQSLMMRTMWWHCAAASTPLSLLAARHGRPNSSDLGPIWDMWGWKNQKATVVGCKTVDEFQHAVRDVLDAMNQKMCQALLDSMPRCQA